MAIASNLKRLRAESGLTQEGLAALSLVPRVSIAQIETGARDNPCLVTLDKIARALGVSVAALVEGPVPRRRVKIGRAKRSRKAVA